MGSSRARLLAVVLTGTYAWALTILPPLTSAASPELATVSAGVALFSLWLSPWLPSGRWSITAALDLFLGLGLLSLWAGREHPISPPLAIFGSFGWLAYTLALGALSTPYGDFAPTDVGPHLEPRTPPSRLSAVSLLAILGGCVLLLALAWRVIRPNASVLAHVFALSAVLVLLRSGAHLATYLQVRGTKLARPPSFRAGLWPLVWFLLSLGGCGAWFIFAR